VKNPTPSAEDRFLIADLCAKYAWSLDTCDTESLVECFSEDAVFDEITIATGRDQIRKLVLQAFTTTRFLPAVSISSARSCSRRTIRDALTIGQ
jgi:ketosteroid isomerase-like protein